MGNYPFHQQQYGHTEQNKMHHPFRRSWEVKWGGDLVPKKTNKQSQYHSKSVVVPVYKTPYHNDENDGVFIILQVFSESDSR
jgi:hypothetical protein